MLIRNILFVTLVLSTSTALALDAFDPINMTELPLQVCGIEILPNYKEFKEHSVLIVERKGERSNPHIKCTAIVIGPRHFLTAKHCINTFSEQESYTVVCPGNIRFPFDMKNQTNARAAGEQRGRLNDLGIIAIEQDISIEPIEFPESEKEYFELLERPENCLQIGFGGFYVDKQLYWGLANRSSARGMRITTGKQEVREDFWKSITDYQNNNRSPRDEFVARVLPTVENILGKTKISLEDPYVFVYGNGQPIKRGDSGGPLLCKNSADKSYKLLGVLTAGVDWVNATYINVWNHINWINKHLKLTPQEFKVSDLVQVAKKNFNTKAIDFYCATSPILKEKLSNLYLEIIAKQEQLENKEFEKNDLDNYELQIKELLDGVMACLKKKYENQSADSQ